MVNFLSVIKVAAIVISHTVSVTNTFFEIPQVIIQNLVQLYSPLGSSSLVGIEPDRVDIKHLSRERNILATTEEDPLPPRPQPPAGSR